MEKVGCGITADFNKKSVKREILNLQKKTGKLEELGRKGIEAAEKEYSWERQEEKLIKVYSDILKN